MLAEPMRLGDANISMSTAQIEEANAHYDSGVRNKLYG